MKLKLLLFALLFSTFVNAQKEYYSYISDKRFTQPDDLLGYDFRPSEMQPKDGRKEAIQAGSYSFGITGNNLYVAGKDLKGVYNMNNINPTEYGFKLSLMNVRNPMIQGHLKVILNEKRQAEALIFKKETKADEIIFFIPSRDSRLKQKENTYFTDRWEVRIEEADMLWGKTIKPFFKVNDYQKRLQIADSTNIRFIETWRVEDKRKKKKSKGEDDPYEHMDFSKMKRWEVEELAETDKRIKIFTEYIIEVKELVRFEDNSTKEEVRKFLVTSIEEREDDTAKAHEERYQLAISVEKAREKEIYIYLTGDRTISSVEIGNDYYLMQE